MTKATGCRQRLTQAQARELWARWNQGVHARHHELAILQRPSEWIELLIDR